MPIMSPHTAPVAPLPRISHRPAGRRIVVEADPALDCTAAAGTPPQPRTTPHSKEPTPMTHTAADTNQHSQLAAPVDVQLGQLIMTASIAAWLETDGNRRAWIAQCIRRHRTGDWGDVHTDDAALNDAAAADGGRLLSSYTYPDEDTTVVWLITEADRSATTILHPADY